MAKVNRVSTQPQYHKVLITVNDPNCSFSINPQISYMKVFKAYSINTAVRAAATYCNKYRSFYPGVEFTYSAQKVEPYHYPYSFIYKEEKDCSISRTKI
jgi:hypothetical protein